MAKLTLQNISAGYVSTAALNANFDAIETALENTLSRDGTAPNQMEADLDLNGNDVLNAGGVYVNGVNILEAMQTIYDNYLSITTNVTVSTAAPSGGTDGDVWFQVSI